MRPSGRRCATGCGARAAKRRMKRMRLLASLAVCALAAACSHAQIDARSNTVSGAAAPAPGTSVASGATGLRIQGGSIATVIAAGVIAAAAMESAREEQRWPSFRESFAPLLGPPPAPELAPGRLVNEQDCTRPIEDWSANLRCR